MMNEISGNEENAEKEINMQTKYLKLSKLVEAMNLRNLTPEIDLEECRITTPEINRPPCS